jgi:hypothetical protein
VAFRITHRWLPAFLSRVVVLAGGARLLLLLLSPWFSHFEITLIGSAASSATHLAEAMISPWKIDGAGPLPFPFAFYSGIHQPYVMGYTGIAGSGALILLLLLLTAERWNGKGAIVVTGALIAAWRLPTRLHSSCSTTAGRSHMTLVTGELPSPAKGSFLCWSVQGQRSQWPLSREAC